MTELEVIPLRAEDVRPLRSLANELYRSAIGNEVDVKFINLLLEDTFGDLRLNTTNLEQERVWVAKDGGRIVGSVQIHPIDKIQCELSGLIVSQEFQGHGVGKLLCKAVEAVAQKQGFAVITLRVNRVCGDAIQVFQKLGYIEVSTSRRALDEDVFSDEFVMVKMISRA
jgi:N-acetylglutamate synthase-like GNAT family acetyltransferase